MTSVEEIAKILRAERDTIGACAGKDILDKISQENREKTKEKLAVLGLENNNSAEIFNALLDKAEEDDGKLPQESLDLFALAKEMAKVGPGFFLKKEKAEEFLLNTPPGNVKLGKDGDLFEVFCSLRFAEDAEWMNKVFFKQFESLTPDDFEERPIQTIVLGERWKDAAEEFLKKKYHNISHLKELGVIFMLPAKMGVPGESLRTLSLALHYYHEIDFYCGLFRMFAKSGDFAQRMISSLRGDVPDKKLKRNQWMIIQQYLAKNDKNDRRLFQPHVNPEALHWKKAENEISTRFSFWEDASWTGNESASFDLVDLVMSLVRRNEMIKYDYHRPEALWNKIFQEIVGGAEKMEELMKDNFERGFIEL